MKHFIAATALLVFYPAQIFAQPHVEFRDASFYRFPGITRLDKKNAIDCNSPAVWVGSTFYLFNSYAQPARGSGDNLLAVRSMTITPMEGEIDGIRLDKLFIWLESVWMDQRGILYGWYHYEPDDVCKPGAHLPTAPRIGALRSKDNGATWEHLGVVIDPPKDSFRCDTPSPWDAGGHGDFSVIADHNQEYLYFLYSSYVKDIGQQGVAVARMRVTDRDVPVGKVFRWHQDQWEQPGIGGLHTAIWSPKIDWHQPNADIFWGPSVHWNSHLQSYVILMSRAVTTGMKGDGTWVSFNRDLANPKGWSEPKQVLTANQAKAAAKGANKGNARNFGWYPQVIGTAPGESDRLAGKRARFFVAGVSRKEIVFLKEGEK
ncbi:MAG: hypothetical protein HUU41_17710 [Bryobacteraceae bacterium]|nr:hypothetical protein [Bryobacterales bacterium]MEB2363244.1 hypothetical protein [Bryobacterales bacterium]NUN02951.1 hypothetical protein [Bryobacteraceae bacterium]